MDPDFFETALKSGKIDQLLNGESIPNLANEYKGSCINCENFCLDFITTHPVPVLNEFIKVDTPLKLERTINLIRTKKKYDDDVQSYALHLVGITDLFVCSVINDGLVLTYQKVKDKDSKINTHKFSIQMLWESFLYKFNSEFNLEIMISVKNLFRKWNDMLKKTKHQKLFDEASYRADHILKRLKNQRDKNVATADLENTILGTPPTENNSSKTSKRNSDKRDYDRLCEIEGLLKSMVDLDTPVAPPSKKPKIGLHKYFTADDEISSDSGNESNKKETLKQTLIESDIYNKKHLTPKAEALKERPDELYKSPVKQLNMNKEEKENDLEVTYFSSNKIASLPPAEKSITNPTSDSIKKSLQYGTPTKKNAYQIMMEAAKKSATKRK